jgi:2-polyprenyl-6-methoxyphenol hydroxylase-like FAD-dependent oxidoreductase
MNGDSASTPPLPHPTADRIEEITEGARLRILVVGAGVAGATFAALLRRRGDQVALVERGSPADDEGYMLGMMPLGGRVLNGLDLTAAYEGASVPMRTYDLYDRHGRRIRSYPLASFVEHYGDWRGIERGTLLGLLRDAAGPILYDTTVTGIANATDHAAVTFADGSTSRFDLVIGADGIPSSLRSLVVDPGGVDDFDTGWGGFVLWADPSGADAATYSELWSAGWGIGLYPVPGRVGLFLAGRHEEMTGRDPHAYADELAARLPSGVFASALSTLDRGAAAFYWRMADCRSAVWRVGRTVLLGDAATAFLPTAGVGAAAAMDSAAALADELSRADSAHMEYALELYERRQRHRVELAQQNSRDLARYMFVNGQPTALVRDQLVRFYSLERLMADISKVMEGE